MNLADFYLSLDFKDFLALLKLETSRQLCGDSIQAARLFTVPYFSVRS